MIWQWSHTQEAYNNVYYNLSQLPIETLREVAAEIKTYTHFHNESTIKYEQGIYESKHQEITNLSTDILVDFIYEFATKQAECTNGGYEAYICPYNCHLISFDKL